MEIILDSHIVGKRSAYSFLLSGKSQINPKVLSSYPTSLNVDSVWKSFPDFNLNFFLVKIAVYSELNSVPQKTYVQVLTPNPGDCGLI
jgi:hypothetical protein